MDHQIADKQAATHNNRPFERKFLALIRFRVGIGAPQTRRLTPIIRLVVVGSADPPIAILKPGRE